MFELKTVGEALDRADWVYAKSYPYIPHYWATDRQWHSENISLIQACHFISTQGVRMVWGKSKPFIRRYVDWGQWRFWHMNYDAFYEIYDGTNTIATVQDMEDWSCTAHLINRQKLEMNKCQLVTPDLPLAKNTVDRTLPASCFPRPPKAKPVNDSGEQLTFI